MTCFLRSSDFILYHEEISRSVDLALYLEEHFIYEKAHFPIMSPYDPKFDLKIM